MTALHAVGGGASLAVRIPHVVEQIGSLAGFAAVAGLAVLSALYFSQARDLRRLREWAGRAPERAAEAAERGQASASPVPGRVVAVPQRSAQAVQPGAPATAAGAGAAAPAAAGGAAGGEPGANGAPPAEAEKPAAQENGEQADGGEGEPAEAPEGEAEKTGAAPAGGEKAQQDGKPEGEAEEAAQPDQQAHGPGDGAQAPGAKPGMPAPASAAAAAAGAGAAAAAGSAAPGSAPPATGPARGPAAPGPGGTRPPTSVLPPRTGAAPPVRRIGGTATANRAINPIPAAAAKARRNPVYVVLAVVGVLVLGAAAAVGVPKLVGNDGGSTPAKPKKAARAKKAAKRSAPIKPGAVTVSVLNGTDIQGLAAQIGDQAQNAGFNLGNTAQVGGVLEGATPQRSSSIVMYVPGHQADGRFVARKMHITGGVEPIDANSRALAGDATVVIVVGRDQTR